MKSKDEFIKFIEERVNVEEMSESVLKFWNCLKDTEEKDKPLFTENGEKIFVFLKNQEQENWKAKEIAEELGLSSRGVSGAIRKLVTDGFVEKMGADPVIYTLSQYGKDFNI